MLDNGFTQKNATLSVICPRQLKDYAPGIFKFFPFHFIARLCPHFEPIIWQESLDGVYKKGYGILKVKCD